GGAGSTNGPGTTTATTSSELRAGAHTITAKATDVAGNVSVASAGLGITIDTSAPSAPATPDMTAATDTGTSSSDDITKNNTPSFSATAEASSTITLLENATTVGS